MNIINEMLLNDFNIKDEVLKFCDISENRVSEIFKDIEKREQYNQYKVIKAMQKNKLSDIHFAASTGYGYNDLGRDVLENMLMCLKRKRH